MRLHLPAEEIKLKQFKQKVFWHSLAPIFLALVVHLRKPTNFIWISLGRTRATIANVLLS